MPSCPVKNFSYSMTGAPSFGGAAGATIAVLDACLVNGFNSQTLTSLAVSSAVLTGTKSTHGYVIDQVLLISGANEAALNGEWQITSVTSDTFSADATGVSNTTGTGTITAKVAPAGWAKVYSGTNKAAYQSTDPASTGMYLRVDDTGTTLARVVGYETMTDVDTGAGPFPTAAQVSGGAYWPKHQTADATARAWQLVADSMGFYFRNEYQVTPFTSLVYFGDYTSEKPADGYSCWLTGWITSPSLSSQYTQPIQSSAQISGNVGSWSPRSYTQIGSAISMGGTKLSFAAMLGWSGPAAGTTYPSPMNNGLVLGTFQLAEGSNYRCLMLPGIYGTPQASPLTHLDVIDNIPELPDRRLLTLSVDNGTAGGRVYIDLTGPWR